MSRHDENYIQECVRLYTERYLDGQNRCQRCHRPLSDPNQTYGWQCAQKLGVPLYGQNGQSLSENLPAAGNSTLLDSGGQVSYNGGSYDDTVTALNFMPNYSIGYTAAETSADLWIELPVLQEAAALAKHIYGEYDLKDPEKKGARITGSWRLIDVWEGRESLKMGIYILDDEDWQNPSEYAVVFRGTSKWIENGMLSSEGRNDIEAATTGKSADLWDAINFAKGFVEMVGDKKVTFIGHSKGGGEAIAAAAYTNKNAITFNAANFNFRKYVSGWGNGTILNYYVEGEILSSLIGKASIGVPVTLKQQYFADEKWYDLPIVKDWKAIQAATQNHDMEAVFQALDGVREL